MPSRVFTSSVATKILVGLTGLALVVYLVIHVVGNLLVFLGPEFFNTYAHTLESNPMIPVIEVGLLLIFLLHVYKTIGLVLRNRRARPVAYAEKSMAGKPSRKTLASSTMILSGLWLLAFLALHVQAFRYGPEYDWPGGGRDLYRLEMENFANPFVVGFYVLSMLVVGAHLSHGISSAFQSMGIDHPAWTPRLIVAGKVFAGLVTVAFILIALWAHFIGGVQA